uniref:Uncharacterized protein n=1 Tax=Phenylobacterium glaciei TaxID=2803784 RepID=A0A974S954_9CAUL|nr:hypothetical protein JKL49_07925 [Phenylobacterium glaciei]
MVGIYLDDVRLTYNAPTLTCASPTWPRWRCCAAPGRALWRWLPRWGPTLGDRTA